MGIATDKHTITLYSLCIKNCFIYEIRTSIIITVMSNNNNNKSDNNDDNFISVSNVFSTVVLIEDTLNKQTNIANRTQIIKKPNWWEVDQLVISTTRSRS